MSTASSPTADGARRSPKRRRLSPQRSSSPDELADAHALPARAPRPPPRPHTPPANAAAAEPRSGSGSPDELDHTFYLRGGRERAASAAAEDVDMLGPEPASSSMPVTPAAAADGDGGDAQGDEQEDGAPRLQYRPCLVLRGHKRGVAAVKFSPDGRWIASCCTCGAAAASRTGHLLTGAAADATCKVWSAATGAHHATLTGHLAGVSTVAWSPDSTLLATGSDDKTIRLWDARAGRAQGRPLAGHHNYVYSVAFSPKGNMLVSGSYDEAVVVWDVRTGRALRTLPAHSDPVGGVDFVHDGTLVGSCATDGLIRVWDTATGQCLRTFFHEDTPPATSVRFAPNGRFVAAWMLDSSVRLWNYVDGRCVKTYQGHRNERYSVGGAFGAYAPGGDAGPQRAFLASGSEDGFVVLWDVVSKRLLQRLEGHDGVVLGVDTHPTEPALVSCGLDRTVRVWRATPAVVGEVGQEHGQEHDQEHDHKHDQEHDQERAREHDQGHDQEHDRGHDQEHDQGHDQERGREHDGL